MVITKEKISQYFIGKSEIFFTEKDRDYCLYTRNYVVQDKKAKTAFTLKYFWNNDVRHLFYSKTTPITMDEIKKWFEKEQPVNLVESPKNTVCFYPDKNVFARIWDSGKNILHITTIFMDIDRSYFQKVADNNMSRQDIIDAAVLLAAKELDYDTSNWYWE